MIKNCLVVVVLVAGPGGLARADDSGGVPVTSARADLAAAVVDPGISSRMASPTTFSAALTAGTDKASGFAQGALKIGADAKVGLKVSTPKATSGDTTIASLGGLSRETTVELSGAYLLWNEKLTVDKFSALCSSIGKPSGCVEKDLIEAGKGKDIRDALGHPVQFKGAVTASYKKFDYLDAMTLAKDHQAKMPFGASGSVSVTFLGRGFLGLSYQYERAFKAGDSAQICMPYQAMGAAGGPLACSTSSIGQPKSDVSHIVTGEWRWRLGTWAALDPQLAYDFQEKVSALEIPVYLLKDENKALVAGISPSWRSDNRKNVGLAIFVGTAFDTRP